MSNVSQVPLNFSMAQVEAVLAEVNDIRSDRRNTFQYRLKNLLKVGLLPHVPAGRGKTASFNACDLFEFAIAVELLQFGMGPERSLDQLHRLRGGILLGAADLCQPDRPLEEKPIYLRFDPFDLEQMTKPVGYHSLFKHRFQRGSITADVKDRRFALINLRVLGNALLTALDQLNLTSTASFKTSMREHLRNGWWVDKP